MVISVRSRAARSSTAGPGGAGIAGEGGDLGGQGGGALVESGQELLGEGDFPVRAGGVGEGVGESEVGLGDGLFAGVAVLLGFGAGGGGGLGHIAVGEVDVAQEPVSAAGPAEGLGGGECGGEVPGCTGEVCEPAGGVGGEAASAFCDLAHAVAGGGALAEVAVRLGPVVQGHLRQFGGQQAGLQDGGEPVGGPGAVFVPAPRELRSSARASAGVASSSSVSVRAGRGRGSQT
ncbi:hypothetical protein ACFWOJ_36265 [Streptomyces sp. NPDC058439]|uniref:hypothetical protein n=1 Tax=Streptomyces sp. NPDC058439 TaxID=3346500 RepID=UPI0036659FFF